MCHTTDGQRSSTHNSAKNDHTQAFGFYSRRVFSDTVTIYTTVGVRDTYYYYWYSALGPVWAETRAQSGDWYSSGMLHPGQVLRGSLPLLSPVFRCSHFSPQVPPRPPRRERSQRRKWELWARMLSSNFAEMTTSTPFRDLLHAANLRHGTDGFTSPPKEGVLTIFLV